jgi:hypothetical protein
MGITQVEFTSSEEESIIDIEDNSIVDFKGLLGPP